MVDRLYQTNYPNNLQLNQQHFFFVFLSDEFTLAFVNLIGVCWALVVSLDADCAGGAGFVLIRFLFIVSSEFL